MPSAHEQDYRLYTQGLPHETKWTRFTRSLQALPQELYDMIYDFTFMPDDRDFAIDDTYRPSHLLRVDRRSRARFAVEYYGSGHPFYVATEGHCRRWIASMQPRYRRYLTEIRIIGPVVRISRALWWHFEVKLVMLSISLRLWQDFMFPYSLDTEIFRYNIDFEGRQYWMWTDEDANDLLARQKLKNALATV